MSLDEVMSLTWRRFTVLFGGVFKWNVPEKPEGRIADTVDWSSLTHRPVKDIMGGGAMSGIGINVNQLPVGEPK